MFTPYVVEISREDQTMLNANESLVVRAWLSELLKMQRALAAHDRKAMPQDMEALIQGKNDSKLRPSQRLL